MFDTEDGDADAGDHGRGQSAEPDPAEPDPAEPDPAAHEPDEYDPESDLPDPERDLVDIPEAPSVPPESAAPEDLRKAFWKLVVVFNVALGSFAVGVMLVAFERRWTVGGALVVLGVASFLRGYYRYQVVTGDDSLWRSDDDSE